MRKVKLIPMLCMAICFILAGSHCDMVIKAMQVEEVTQVKQVETDPMEEPIETEEPVQAKVQNGFEVTLNYGYEKAVKFNRFMSLKASIKNNGGNFSGGLQVVSRTTYGNENVMYQKDVTIAEGETKEITLEIPILSPMKKIMIKLQNAKGKTVWKQKVKLDVEYDASVLFEGILTDERNNMGYLSNNGVKIFYLTEETFADTQKGLDSLDIIVIYNFSTGKLNKEQYEALKAWVKAGGTLVLGTGATGNKTLELFQDDFLTGKIGDLSKQGLLELKMDNSKTVTLDDSKTKMQLIEKEDGRICLFSTDMGLNYKNWDMEGRVIESGITKNLSETKRRSLKEDNNNLRNDIMLALDYNDFKMPSVGKYALILMIYILLIGPPLYFILKKKDKRNFVWVLVPSLALVFSFGIYLIGSDTRISKPFIRYMNVFTLDGTGANKGTESTFFSITAPYNKEYNVAVPPESDIQVAGTSIYSYGMEEDSSSSLDDYKVAIKNAGDRTTIQIKDFAAFTPVYFSGKSKRQETGSYQSAIHSYEHKLSGTFTNELGYDLEKCILICDGFLVSMGDISNGESVDLSNIAEESIIPSYSATNYMYQNEIVDRMIQGDIYYDVDAAKRFQVLQSYIDKQDQNYLIGFQYKDAENQFKSRWGMDSSGMNTVAIPIEANHVEKNIEFIPNLNPYIVNIIEGDLDIKYGYMQEDCLVEYQFNQEDLIKSIRYDKEANIEFYDYETDKAFDGTIKAYNYKTNQYDTLFVSGKEGEITNMKDYLDSNNKMLLKYEVSNKQNKYQENSFPYLSATKEVK